MTLPKSEKSENDAAYAIDKLGNFIAKMTASMENFTVGDICISYAQQAEPQCDMATC